jgi:predicted Mrr-cat superfamily restriction endonuclease
VYEMRAADLFVFPVRGMDEVLIGRVEGGYEFRGEHGEPAGGDSGSARAVKWLGSAERRAFSAGALACFDAEHTVHCGGAFRGEVMGLLVGRRLL